MELLEANGNGIKIPVQTEDKPKKERAKRNLAYLPTAATVAEMNQVEYSGLAEKTAVGWDSLKNYEIFSLSADGSFPMMKVSRSKAVRLADRQVIMVGGGVCWLSFFVKPSKPKQALVRPRACFKNPLTTNNLP